MRRVDHQHPVVVVGAGISGVACARELSSAGLPVVVRDRGRRVGGRMAVRTIDGRPVDTGASYLTVSDDAFAAVVEDWHRRGLAHPWTDTFATAGPDGLSGTTTGPVRWAAAGGLRSLVEDLARGLVLETGVDVAEVGPGLEVDGVRASAVVLAMPGPQAHDLLSDDLSEGLGVLAESVWHPALSLFARWDERCWPEVDGVFVNDSAVLSWVADDGRRRGDGAPVLVAHSTAGLAQRHLDAPDGACEVMLTELSRLLDVDRRPRWVHVKRWSLARPADPREEPFVLTAAGVGLCGDGWHRPSRVETAYLSGRGLGRALVDRLT